MASPATIIVLDTTTVNNVLRLSVQKGQQVIPGGEPSGPRTSYAYCNTIICSNLRLIT